MVSGKTSRTDKKELTRIPQGHVKKKRSVLYPNVVEMEVSIAWILQLDICRLALAHQLALWVALRRQNSQNVLHSNSRPTYYKPYVPNRQYMFALKPKNVGF